MMRKIIPGCPVTPGIHNAAVPTPRSWGFEIYTHFRHDAEGKWTDHGMRYASEEAAKTAGLSLLRRILATQPTSYIDPDETQHCRVFPSDDAPNAGHADLPVPVPNGRRPYFITSP